MQRRLALFVCLFLLSFSLFVSFFYLVPWPWIVFRPKANMNTHTHTHTHLHERCKNRGHITPATRTLHNDRERYNQLICHAWMVSLGFFARFNMLCA